MIFKSKDKNREQTDSPVTFPVIFLRDNVIIPFQVTPLVIGRMKSVKALKKAMSEDHTLFLVAQKDASIREPTREDLYEMGTIVTILQHIELPDGTIKILVEGKIRGKIVEIDFQQEVMSASILPLFEKDTVDIEVDIIIKRVLNKFEELTKYDPSISKKNFKELSRIKSPARFSDQMLNHLNGLTMKERQDYLETESPVVRLEKILVFLSNRLEVLSLEQKIQERVKNQIEQSQREYYLNEQLKAIYNELGNKKGLLSPEFEELKKSLNDAALPAEARKKAFREFSKLKSMAPLSAEATVIRNYLDWFTVLPWNEETEEIHDLDAAIAILDEDHYGLQKVKERIVEHLAVHQLVEKMQGSILCFVGPPGVGKTSLAKSVARSMGRKFVRLSLGGVRDEAEIRGHRRTYIGSMPGRIIQSMKKVGCKNPVFLLDEIDKMGYDFRGDPASALLEVLDPEQNHAFSDHYLEVDFDLSKVFFITTANIIYNIPPALQDRMEVISLPGYMESEKIRIATDFLIPKMLKAHGLTDDDLSFSEGAITSIIRYYTREAGVRNLERQIATICRKVAKKKVMKQVTKKVRLYERDLHRYLGVRKFQYGKRDAEASIGTSTGLAWTEVGGDILTIETTILEGKGNLILTGNMGEVMQESAKAALSYVRSRRTQLKLTSDFYKKSDIHIHIPQGAIPKDGPSAGITIATSLVSALIKKPVDNDLAMTGEITLRGRVLPIGGLKEKVLAAHRDHISKIIIPAENKRNLKEIPQQIKKGIKFIPVEHVDEVLKIAFSDDISDDE